MGQDVYLAVIGGCMWAAVWEEVSEFVVASTKSGSAALHSPPRMGWYQPLMPRLPQPDAGVSADRTPMHGRPYSHILT
jgi:hypothetical protein